MTCKISQWSPVLALTLLGTVLSTTAIAQMRDAIADDAPDRNVPTLERPPSETDEQNLLSPLPDVDDSMNTVDDPRPATTPTAPTEPLESTFIEDGGTVSVDEFSDGLTGYLLGPGDQLGISVVGIDDLQRNRIILPDGTILLPLIGAVPAAGRTLVELESDITRRLSFYVVDPVVEVNLNTLRPVVVTVAGQVNRPGPVQLNSLSTFNTTVGANAQLVSETTSPTISTALIGAGGVLRDADLSDVTVRRLLPDGREVDLQVNLWETIFQGRGESNILLQDGDVVFVPEAVALANPVNPQVVARSSLAPETVSVRVIGEVNRPGEVQVPTDGSVSSAIAIAGGYDTDTANLSQIALVRMQDNGQVEEQMLDLNANLIDSTPIRDGDMIVVPKRGYLNTLDTIGRALGPLTAPFNFLLLLDRVF